MKRYCRLSKRRISQDLNLPVIKEPLPGPPVLSMEEYLIFVEQNRKPGFDQKAYREWKKKAAVNVHFKLIP